MLKMSWYAGVNRFVEVLHRAKTRLWYRMFFKRIGTKSVIQSPIFISNPQFIEIGDRVTIRNGARLEVVLDGVTREPSLRIGSNTNIEQNVHIICHDRVTIGSDVSITGNCAIVDTEHPYDIEQTGLKIGNRISTESSFVEIEDGAFIGYGSIVMPNVHIGKGAVIGAHSLVNKNVDAYTVVCGNPLRIIRVYKVA